MEARLIFKGCTSVDDCIQILNAMIELAPDIYSKPGKYPCNKDEATHKAKMMFIEEIVKDPCKHNPANDRLRKDLVSDLVTTRCLECGVELVADWKAK